LGTVGRLPERRNLTGDWVVSGRTVHVNVPTWIEQQQLLGEEGEGARVWVFGGRNADGTVTASYIRVLHRGTEEDDARAQ
jgi:hypothetical protein